IQVAQKKVKKAFENADSSSRVELIPSKIKPDPDPAQARSLTGPPTIVDWWSGGGQRWSSGSQRWWRLGEWEDDTSDGTVVAAEKISTRFREVRIAAAGFRKRNDLVAGLPKFKYHKEHLCPSCEQRKSKRASHLPKSVPNSRQRLHLLHMDLCGPMRIAIINGKRYVLVIVDDYSRYTWAEAIATARFTQNRSIIHRRFNKKPYELINGRKPNISFLHVFGALCYPKNDREDIGKLGAKGDIGFFIGYSADSCTYRVYNSRTKKIIETMNVSFDEISAMAFEQHSSKPGLQSMTSGQISSGLDLTYAPSTITTQQPSESELNLFFEAMYDDYIGGQPSATARTVLPAQEPQVRQMSTASTTIADIAPTPTNSSSLATNIPITSQDVDELNLNAMVDGNTFVNPFANSSTSTAASSSSQNVDPSNMYTFYQPYPYEFQWTKDHPLEQDSGFELTGFSGSDYAGCEDTFKSTSGGAQFLCEKLVSWSLKK
nr:hypothetical protein [Tanacetum cinerariifolium]